MKWRLGSNIKGLKLKYDKNVQPGDIGVIRAQIHRSVISDVRGERLDTIDGNTDYQSIKKRSRPRGDIWYYYSPK